MACGSPRPLFAALRQAENMQLAVLALPVAFSCSRRGNPPPCPFRCFLTRRIDYFRALAPLFANTRKSETSEVQVLTSEALPHMAGGRAFSPLYGTNRGCFSAGKCPWNEISMGWIGDSMGWKSEFMECFGRNTPRGCISKAKTRSGAGGRFNGLPNSA